MSKLGIAIKPTISGNFHPVTINEGDWTRKIHDVRPALLHFPELQDDHSKIASLFFFDEKGCFIVLARTITDNDLENISGWIYVPHDMQISTKQLEGVIGVIRRMISVSVLPEKSKLEEIFGNRELPTIKNAPIYESSPRNGEFAKRRARGKSLAELLSGNRFLPVYAKYESILVETTAGEVEGVNDITEVCDREQAFLESQQKRQRPVKASHRPQPTSAAAAAKGQPAASRRPQPDPRTKQPVQQPPYSPVDRNSSAESVRRPAYTPPVDVETYSRNTRQYREYDTDSKNTSIKYGSLIAAFLLGIAVGVLVTLLFSRPSNEEPEIETVEVMPVEAMEVVPDSTNADSLEVIDIAPTSADTTVTSIPTVSATPAATTPQPTSQTSSYSSKSKSRGSESSRKTTTTTGTYTGGGGSNTGSLNIRQGQAGGGRKVSAPPPATNSKPATATQPKSPGATQPKPTNTTQTKPAAASQPQPAAAPQPEKNSRKIGRE